MKRVIDPYYKATADDAGVAALLVADLEATCRVFDEVGRDEPLVGHAYALMERLHKTLEVSPPTPPGRSSSRGSLKRSRDLGQE